MLSVLLTLLCLGGLLLLSISQFKVNKLVKENVKVNKNNLNYRSDSAKMSYEIENLINVSKEMNKYNNILKKKHDELMSENGKLAKRVIKLENQVTTLENRVEFLEDENRKINRALETHNLIASNSKIDKSFMFKIVK